MRRKYNANDPDTILAEEHNRRVQADLASVGLHVVSVRDLYRALPLNEINELDQKELDNLVVPFMVHVESKMSPTHEKSICIDVEQWPYVNKPNAYVASPWGDKIAYHLAKDIQFLGLQKEPGGPFVFDLTKKDPVAIGAAEFKQHLKKRFDR